VHWFCKAEIRGLPNTTQAHAKTRIYAALFLAAISTPYTFAMTSNETPAHKLVATTGNTYQCSIQESLVREEGVLSVERSIPVDDEQTEANVFKNVQW
jgi:hypothetical protein